MERRVGTCSRGIRCPIIREGDDLAAIVTESVLDAAKSEGFELRDRDVISITESSHNKKRSAGVSRHSALFYSSRIIHRTNKHGD